MNYRCVTDIADLRAYLAGHSEVAFDFETAPDDAFREEERAALDPHKAHIVGVSFSVAPASAVYVPIRHRIGKNADEADLLDFLSIVMRDHATNKIAHNLAFESMFLYARGIVILPASYDTIAAAQLTLKTDTEFRGLSEAGLKRLATALCGADMPDFETVTAGRHFDELDPASAEAIRYACADSDYTLRLYHLFNAWFDRYLPRHRELVQNVESPAAVYSGIMKYNGLLVDVEKMRAKGREAADTLLKRRADLEAMTGVQIGANAATAAFKRYLYDELGLPLVKTTEKQKQAADDEALVLLADHCQEKRPELVPLFARVQEYRRLGKIRATYIDGFLKHVNSATGRIHPNLYPLGTETGRFSARSPNVQNCPRKDNDPIGVRSFFVAPPGHVLLSLDFSQIELRVGAFYCRDEKMLEAYRTGGDIHAQTTSVIYKIPFEQAADKHQPNYKERRAIAKNCNFGVFFGLFPKGLQRNLRLKAGLTTTLEECQAIIDSLKAGYPRLSAWQRQAVRQAKIRRYTETALGRRRYLPGLSSGDWKRKGYAERCALNSPIQGTAAEILKLAMARILEGLPARPWLKPLLQIHDELLFELPESEVNGAIQFIKKCMEMQPFPAFDIPIVAEASVGPDFGQMAEI